MSKPGSSFPVELSDDPNFREFTIPLPSESPLPRMPLEDKLGGGFTRDQLRVVGVHRPSKEDFQFHVGITHVWRYYEEYFRSRAKEIIDAGWELAEPFDPKRDVYGVLTSSAIRNRFVLEEVAIPAGWNKKVGIVIMGIKLGMNRKVAAE